MRMLLTLLFILSCGATHLTPRTSRTCMALPLNTLKNLTQVFGYEDKCINLAAFHVLTGSISDSTSDIAAFGRSCGVAKIIRIAFGTNEITCPGLLYN
jgi:hypothetical protein